MEQIYQDDNSVSEPKRSKTFNFYCDESCHLEHDNMSTMLIGYISCAYNQVKLHNNNIRKIKAKYHLFTEAKWTTISKSSFPFYCELIDYFFATDLQYRAIVIDKNQINHAEHDQNHDDFYYKMYYQLLNKKILPENKYNIYLDIKDTRSAKKVANLRNYLNVQYLSVNNLQNIRSHESELMQLADIITGAIGYHRRGLNKVIAKNKIIEKIKAHSKEQLNKSTPPTTKKFNLFFIDLK